MDEHVRKLISELPLAPTGIITQKEYGEYFLPTYQRVCEEPRKHADLDAGESVLLSHKHASEEATPAAPVMDAVKKILKPRKVEKA